MGVKTGITKPWFPVYPDGWIGGQSEIGGGWIDGMGLWIGGSDE